MSHDCHMIISSKQVNLYDRTFRPIVDAVLEGYNGIHSCLTSLIKLAVCKVLY